MFSGILWEHFGGPAAVRKSSSILQLNDSTYVLLSTGQYKSSKTHQNLLSARSERRTLPAVPVVLSEVHRPSLLLLLLPRVVMNIGLSEMNHAPALPEALPPRSNVNQVHHRTGRRRSLGAGQEQKQDWNNRIVL